jgi:hypothetical protein
MRREQRLNCWIEPRVRIELRSEDGPLLGVLYLEPLCLEIKRKARIFDIDLLTTIASGEAAVVERVQKPLEEQS